jgi:hypothetical protein
MISETRLVLKELLHQLLVSVEVKNVISSIYEC